MDFLPPDDVRVLALRDILAFVADSDFVRAVYLYGSLAEGNLIPTSDLDLMLVLRDTSPRGVGGRLQEACTRIARQRGVPADVFALPESHVARYGRLVLSSQARCVLGTDLPTRHALPSPADLARQAAGILIRPSWLTLAR